MISMQEALSRPVHQQACRDVADEALAVAASYEKAEREYLDLARSMEDSEHMEDARQEALAAAKKARDDADAKRQFAGRVMAFGSKNIRNI